MKPILLTVLIALASSSVAAKEPPKDSPQAALERCRWELGVITKESVEAEQGRLACMSRNPRKVFLEWRRASSSWVNADGWECFPDPSTQTMTCYR